MTHQLIDNPRGYLFLDVDGVLNPFSDDRTVRIVLPSPDWELRRIYGFRVWVGQSVSDWLNGLLDSGVQIVWATTWVQSEHALRELAENWSLPTELPRIFGVMWNDALERQQDCGKRSGVEAWLTEHDVDPAITPVVWVDDDLGPGDRKYARERGVCPFAVDAEVGLSETYWRDVIESSLAGGGAAPARAQKPVKAARTELAIHAGV